MIDCLSELVSIGQGATVADPSAELPTSSSRPSLHPQPLSSTADQRCWKMGRTICEYERG
ncbi:hypothetical protein IG631_17810 [Alternaria alternata]|nr:hypothetical protein IG631_17810 [Alternaria alternata]